MLPGGGSGFRLDPSQGLGRLVCTLAHHSGFAAALRALARGPLGARPLSVGALCLLGSQMAVPGVCDRVLGLWGAG